MVDVTLLLFGTAARGGRNDKKLHAEWGELALAVSLQGVRIIYTRTHTHLQVAVAIQGKSFCVCRSPVVSFILHGGTDGRSMRDVTDAIPSRIRMKLRPSEPLNEAAAGGGPPVWVRPFRAAPAGRWTAIGWPAVTDSARNWATWPEW